MIGFRTLLRSSVGSICGGCIEIVDDTGLVWHVRLDQYGVQRLLSNGNRSI